MSTAAVAVPAAAHVRATRGRPTCRCGRPLDPAAAAGHDGTPNVHNQHPGCEQRPTLRVIRGGRR